MTESDRELLDDRPPADMERVVARVLAECVDRIQRGERIDPEDVISRQPEAAADILRELETFESIAPPGGEALDRLCRRGMKWLTLAWHPYGRRVPRSPGGTPGQRS